MKRKEKPKTLIDIFKNCNGYHGFNHLGYKVVIHYENSEMTKVEVNGVTFVREVSDVLQTPMESFVRIGNNKQV